MKILQWKRMLGLAMAVIILFQAVSPNYVYAYAEAEGREAAAPSEETYVGDFNLSTYRADVCLKDGTP